MLGLGLPQSGPLLGVAQGLCRQETVGVGPRPKTKPASQSGGLGMLFYFFAKRRWDRCIDFKLNRDAVFTEFRTSGATFLNLRSG